MYKNIGKCSLAVLMVFSLFGCSDKSSNSGSSDVSDEKVKEAVVSDAIEGVSQDLKDFVAIVFSRDIFSGKFTEMPLFDTSERALRVIIAQTECANGGSMEVDQDVNMESAMGFMITTKRFNNCKMGQKSTDGEIESSIVMSNGSPSIMKTTFLSDYILTDGNRTISILKKSTIAIHNMAKMNFSVVEDLDLIENDLLHSKSEAWKMEYSRVINGISFYPSSGSKSLSGQKYTIDSSYDMSKTPISINSSSQFTKGGKFVFLDDDNQKIILESVGVNKIKISLDSDADGNIERYEVIDI